MKIPVRYERCSLTNEEAMRRIKKVLYNLMFAALLGLFTVPSMLILYTLANGSDSLLCVGCQVSIQHNKDTVPGHDLLQTISE